MDGDDALTVTRRSRGPTVCVKLKPQDANCVVGVEIRLTHIHSSVRRVVAIAVNVERHCNLAHISENTLLPCVRL